MFSLSKHHNHHVKLDLEGIFQSYYTIFNHGPKLNKGMKLVHLEAVSIGIVTIYLRESHTERERLAYLNSHSPSMVQFYLVTMQSSACKEQVKSHDD